MKEIKIKYWPNGKIKYEWPMLNGRWHGIQKGWYENGFKSYVFIQKQGNTHGLQIFFV